MIRKLGLFALVLCMLMAVTPARAGIITFATIGLASGHPIDLTDTSGVSDTIYVDPSAASTTVVPFYFLNLTGSAFSGLFDNGETENVTLTMSATSTTGAVLGGGNITQNGWSGTVALTLTLAQQQFICTSHGMAANCLGALTNVLTMTFGPTGQTSGTNGGSSLSLNDATPPSTEVLFTSDFLNFGATNSESFALSLGLTNGLSADGGTPNLLNTNTMSLNGTFNVDQVTTVPEPMTMSLIGGGLIGLGVLARRRRRA